MFWIVISGSLNFPLVDFVNCFISSIPFRKFWSKIKLCVHSSPRCFIGLSGVGSWADGSSMVLKIFLKNRDPWDFWDSGKTKVPYSENKKQWLVSSARFSSTNLRSLVCLILQESSTSSIRPLLHMYCNKFGRFSIDHTFSSPILSKCILILSIDGLFWLTYFMYVIVSITLSSIISIIVGSKILIASLLDNVLMDWWKILTKIK